jgi:WhiB family redox-sensing transcriptional regulator
MSLPLLVPVGVISIVEAVREDWRLYGRCRGYRDPDLWYSSNRREQAKARAICDGCPVKLECLAYSLRRPEPYGVWGGIAQGERGRRVRRGRSVATSST